MKYRLSEALLADAAATDALGYLLARTRPAAAVVYLIGDLGTGKSTLARALLRALGVPGAIRSPTYTLVECYVLPDGTEALHLDLYRIAEVGELEYLGLADTQADLWLVEWPERGVAALPPADLEIHLTIADSGRQVRLVGATAVGRKWRELVEASGDLRPVSFVS